MCLFGAANPKNQKYSQGSVSTEDSKTYRRKKDEGKESE